MSMIDDIIESRDVAMVWLDLDDTLQDFHANSREALERLHGVAGLGRWFATVEGWCECYMRHNRELWALYAAGATTKEALRRDRFVLPLIDGGCPRDEAVARWRELDTAYLDLLAQGRHMVEGAMELLGHLRDRGMPLGILSNGFKEVQYRKIATAGIGGYFRHVVLSDDIGIQKPDSRIFDHAMGVAGYTDPSRMLMIGDNPVADINGATGAGWQAIYFNRAGLGDPRPGITTVTSLSCLLETHGHRGPFRHKDIGLRDDVSMT